MNERMFDQEQTRRSFYFIQSNKQNDTVKQLRFPKTNRKICGNFFVCNSIIYHFLIFQQLSANGGIVRPRDEIFGISRGKRFIFLRSSTEDFTLSRETPDQ